MGRHAGPIPPHGTRSRYKLGCRCNGCRGDHNAYMRAYRVRVGITKQNRRTYDQLELPAELLKGWRTDGK